MLFAASSPPIMDTTIYYMSDALCETSLLYNKRLFGTMQYKGILFHNLFPTVHAMQLIRRIEFSHTEA